SLPTINVAPDGSGGAYVVQGSSDFSEGIRIQHLTNAGTVASGWPADGLQIGVGLNPVVASDGSGGALASWYGGGVKAQKVSSSGSTQWTANGVVVATTGGAPDIVSDGAGGAIVAYAQSGMKVQRINSSGSLAWGSATSLGTGSGARIATDASGGA